MEQVTNVFDVMPDGEVVTLNTPLVQRDMTGSLESGTVTCETMDVSFEPTGRKI